MEEFIVNWKKIKEELDKLPPPTADEAFGKMMEFLACFILLCKTDELEYEDSMNMLLQGIGKQFPAMWDAPTIEELIERNDD